MTLFKKKISKQEFIDLLLGVLLGKIEDQVVNTFKKPILGQKNAKPIYEGEEKDLKYEARIFALWLLTISLPPKNDELKDLLHDTFCAKLNINGEDKRGLYQDIEKRYRVYYEAFNKWAEKKDMGYALGGVITDIITRKNVDFSIKNYLPKAGIYESLQVFMLFGELFKMTLEIIGNTKNKFKVEGLNF